MEKLKNYLMVLSIVSIPVSAIIAVMGIAHANDTSMCYAINDADHRSFCLAKSRRDASMCYAVQRAELRAQCLAEVRK